MTFLQFNSDTSELGGTQIWWLDNIAGGTQNVVVTHTGVVRIAVYTMTVAGGQAVAVDADTGVDTTTSANPSWTMATTASTNTFGVEVLHGGWQTATNTPATGWTLATGLTAANMDRGAVGWGSARGTSIFTGGNVTCGWTHATSEDWCGSSAAFKEITPPVEVIPDVVMAPPTAGY